MKRFIQNILYLILIVVGWQLIGEYAYTYVYNHGAPRNKVMWVRALEDPKLDYAVLGSSRAQYHVNPVLIDSITGLIGYNFGHQNSYPFEINLMAHELLKRAEPSRLLIQVDYTYNMDGPDIEASIPWVPYIKEAHIYQKFQPHGDLYGWFRYVPFYRYQYFESELGIRNVALSALGKQPDFYSNRGFYPIDRKLQDLDPFDHQLVDQENQSLKSLQQLCAEKNVKTEFFIAPLRDFTGNLHIIAKYLPGLRDYSMQYDDPTLFSDPIHLMSPGARRFSLQLSEDIFQK